MCKAPGPPVILPQTPAGNFATGWHLLKLWDFFHFGLYMSCWCRLQCSWVFHPVLIRSVSPPPWHTCFLLIGEVIGLCSKQVQKVPTVRSPLQVTSMPGNQTLARCEPQPLWCCWILCAALSLIACCQLVEICSCPVMLPARNYSCICCHCECQHQDVCRLGQHFVRACPAMATGDPSAWR